MKIARNRIGVIGAAALLIAAAACSHKAPEADASLAADLKAATGNQGQVVVSALEGGPESAPKKAAPQRIYKAAPRAEPRVAAAEAQPTPQPAPASAPAQVVTQSAPTPEPAPVVPAPAAQNRPTPVQTQQRQPGVYKTEGEIFSKMPWIRP